MGHSCLGPGDAGRGRWSPAQPRPGHPHNAPAPRPPLGRGEAAGEAGALRPPEGAWARAQPSRWLGRRPGGPSPAPQPDTGESGTASSPFPEEALSEAGFPACTPTRAACAAGAGPAPFSSRRAAFLPPSLRPGDISFPLSLPRGFSQAEMGPWETRNQSRESPGHSLHHPPTYTRIRCRRSPEHVPRPAASRPRLGEAPSVSNPRSRCGTRRSEGKWLARGLRARPWWSPGPLAHAPLRP